VIPLATTTIDVRRVPLDSTRDAADIPPAARTVARGIRAHFSYVSGAEVLLGGQETTDVARLACDPCDLTHTDQVVDNRDGTVWEVAGVFRAGGWGLDHLRADVRRVEGQS